VSKLKIPTEDALDLYHSQSGEQNGVIFVAKEFMGEWRWGVTYQLVVQDKLTEKYYEKIVQEQSGDHWYLSLEEEAEETEFDLVERVAVVTYEYKRPSDVER
jgi:hypothetical protein